MSPLVCFCGGSAAVMFINESLPADSENTYPVKSRFQSNDSACPAVPSIVGEIVVFKRKNWHSSPFLLRALP
jgi:hypothetical protein